MKNITTIIFLSFTVLSAGAAELKDSALIHFQQSKSYLDTTLMHNGENLRRMTQKLDSALGSESGYSLSSVRVIGAASPEGSVSINGRLSEKRAKRIFNYFANRTPMADSIVSFIYIGRDWSGLLAMVEKDDKIPYRDDVIATINNIREKIASTGKDSEENLRILKQLHSGVPYSYMYRKLFPDLRASRLYVEYIALKPVVRPLAGNPYGFIDTEITIVPEIGEIYLMGKLLECKPFYMGLKTNLLYDALALPSVGAEFYIGKGWSVIGDWTYGWWDKNTAHRYWRAYGGTAGIRKWFGKRASGKPLTGHHIGLFAGAITYDFEFGGKGYMGGLPGKSLWDRCNIITGVEYGYSLPIANRLNLDFTLGIGYLGGKVIEYRPEGGDYIWQSTRHFNWIGPTKAEISLVWLIGCGNFNGKKGGGL